MKRLKSLKGLKYPLLLDGGFGRELEKNNISIAPPLWSANAFYTDEEIVKKIHKDFILAGSDIITTNTYAVTNYLLKKADKEHDQNILLDKAYAMAKRARAELNANNVLIAASIPPLNESYRSDLVDVGILEKEYEKLIDSALKNQADIILAETLTTIAEAKSILKLTVESKVPVWISFCVNEYGNLRSGENLEDAVNICIGMKADAILVNCSSVFDTAKSMQIFEVLSQRKTFIYGAYANRFTPIRDDFSLTSGLNSIDENIDIENYSKHAEKWLEHGAKIIGGCCGIGSDYIKDINQNVLV